MDSMNEQCTNSKRVKEIARFYFFCNRHLKFMKCVSDSQKSETDYQAYVTKVQKAYNKLDSLEQVFINNDFFYQAYPGWWMKFYTRATYYRIRKRSVDRFLEAFESEY